MRKPGRPVRTEPDRPAGRRRAIGRDERGVTPIIGSILILAMTVLGVVAVMFWGAPTIQEIQDRNAQLGVVGEFEEIRLSSLALTVPDASRTPTLVMQSGTVGIEEGTRFMITANHDASNTGCDLHVTGWEAAGVSSVTVSGSGCRDAYNTASCPGSGACFEILNVSGDNLVPQTVTGGPMAAGGPATFTVAGADFSSGDYVFRITNGLFASLEVYAEAWLLGSDMHTWRLGSPQGERAVHQDGSAIFSRTDDDIFIERDPPIQEDAFGSGDYVLWLRTYSATARNEVSGRNSVTMFLGLVGTYTRINNETVDSLRYDFEGELAEAWCTALVQRTAELTTDASYTSPGGCDAAVPSVVYATTSGASFPMEFLHAHIRTTLLI